MAPSSTVPPADRGSGTRRRPLRGRSGWRGRIWISLALTRTGDFSSGGSSFSPFATILIASSGNGRWSNKASTVSASNQRSNSSGVVRMTRMALGWMCATIALASVVRKPNSRRSPSIGAVLGPRTPRQEAHRPAKANKGRSSVGANQIGVLRGQVSAYSQNEVAGTRQRFSLPSPPRQCGLLTLRMFVTGAPPYWSGPGMPQHL